MYTLGLFEWMRSHCLVFVKWDFSASLGEGIMNELLRHQNLCNLFYLLVVKVGSGMGDCLGGGGPLWVFSFCGTV